MDYEEVNCNFKDSKMIRKTNMGWKGRGIDMDRRPRLFLVYADSVFAARCSRHFRRMGWDVHKTSGGEEICQWVDRLAPNAVVIDTELPGDSAWQTCARITHEHPGLTVVLLAADRLDDEERRRQVGANAVVSRSAGVEGLAERVFGASPAHVI